MSYAIEYKNKLEEKLKELNEELEKARSQADIKKIGTLDDETLDTELELRATYGNLGIFDLLMHSTNSQNEALVKFNIYVVINIMMVKLSSIYKIKKFDYKTLQKCIKEMEDIIEYYNKIKPPNRDLEDFVVIDIRNKVATEKMVKALEYYKYDIGVVVFGAGHIDGLIQEFIKLTKGNINIIVARFLG